ncbi:permease prefix domain 1-containing protein [Pseudoflavonifractor phocaeensis]|uniref:permease prefix domain 1-containing protein n=1 Tax=Pseudoflavonifractor phocaeensis TaxID=1870988 RepID=UPI001F3EF9D4|nr:permease prefix domain 1-containing protein [Pseudoflavonifractor phocaeensis]MCF2662681.1 hypothetical protein [Pseudoflavonifractor phocaeensis]
MDNMDRNGWLHTAVAGIRFKPDRAAVEAELREHIEDKTLDLMRIFPDMTAEKAGERALFQMGDPEEIGKELAKIHKPWLGYLWVASKWAVGLMVLLLVWLGLTGRFGGDAALWMAWDVDRLPQQGGMVFQVGELSAEEIYLPGDDPAQLMTDSTRQKARVMGNTVTLERAALWQAYPSTLWNSRKLFVYLRVDSPRFWEKAVLREGWLKITDNTGRGYSFDSYQQVVENRFRRVEEGPFHTGWQLELGIREADVRWIRLDYGPGEPVFSFTVEIEEGTA